MYRRIHFFTVGKMRKKKIKKGILLCVAAMLVLCVGMCLKHYKYIVRIKNDYQNLLTDYPETEYEQVCAGLGDKIMGIQIVYSKGLTVKDIKLKKQK